MAAETSDVEKLALKGRDDAQIQKLQLKKIEARDKLRSLRAEMRGLDAEMIRYGANGFDLDLACW